MHSLVRRTLVVAGAPALAVSVWQAIWAVGHGEALCLVELAAMMDVTMPGLRCAPSMHLLSGIIVLGGVHGLVILPALWISRRSPERRSRTIGVGVGVAGVLALTVGLTANSVPFDGLPRAVGGALEITVPIVVLGAVAFGLTRPAAAGCSDSRPPDGRLQLSGD